MAHWVPWFSHKTWWFSIAKNKQNHVPNHQPATNPWDRAQWSAPPRNSAWTPEGPMGTQGDPGGHESKSRCFLFPSPGYDMLWYFRKMAGKKVRYSRKFDDSWWLKHENWLQMTILWWFLASTLVTHLHFSQKMRSKWELAVFQLKNHGVVMVILGGLETEVGYSYIHPTYPKTACQMLGVWDIFDGPPKKVIFCWLWSISHRIHVCYTW